MSPSERTDALVAGDPPEADEQRLARLIYELQATKPAAPEQLRERIELLGEAESTRRPTLLERLSLRRAVLVLVPAILIVSVGAAAVQGIVTATSPGNNASEEAARATPQVAQEALRRVGETRSPQQPEAFEAYNTDDERLRGAAAPPLVQSLAKNPRAAAVPTSRGRTQDYYAALRLRVDDLDDLSAKTQQALRMTRGYGGYVVSVDYGNPRAGQGDSTLELRIPVGRVQQALVAFSDLGSILSQQVSIRDLQGRIDRFTREIRNLQEHIAKLELSLRDPNLTVAERDRIEAQIVRARRSIAAQRAERTALAQRGQFAKVSLALTTRKPIAKPDEESRIERAVGDAGSVFAREVAFGLYALIVASPFLLLIALALAGARAGRRRADQRLLERA